jgi:hypothetical protein
MLDDKQIKFFRRLYNRTQIGKVTWESTSEEGIFQLNFPNYSIKIAQEMRDYGKIDTFLQILNEENNIIETIDDEDIKSSIGVDGVGMIEDLYRKARGQAMGIEEALDILIEALGEDEGSEDDPL